MPSSWLMLIALLTSFSAFFTLCIHGHPFWDNVAGVGFENFQKAFCFSKLLHNNLLKFLLRVYKPPRALTNPCCSACLLILLLLLLLNLLPYFRIEDHSIYNGLNLSLNSFAA